MFQKQKFNRRILVSPLDWGLGHATRCIPVIRSLLDFGCEVWIASAGPQKKLLAHEFPDLPILHLPGYGIHYGKNGVMFRLLRQIPVIRRHIITEHGWLQQAIARYGFHGIISDNRYGLHSHKAPSVLITHQLNLQVPRWASLFKNGVNNLLLQHITPFQSCWIPDMPQSQQSLAGDMSHPARVPEIPTQYIGWLSRFVPKEQKPIRGHNLLVSLSGPEPQRTLLEQKLLRQLTNIKQPVTMVRGLPECDDIPKVPHHITLYNHLPATQMQHEMEKCRLLISRSGYSTLMDAMVTGTPMAGIPTPGQTEQEYLARRLQEKGWVVSRNQHEINLEELIAAAGNLDPKNLPVSTGNLLHTAMRAWLQTL